MTTSKQGINRKISILISVLLLQSVAMTINASNDGFSGESHFSHPPDEVDLTPWTIDCYDDFEAIWIWQSDDLPAGIDPPADSNFGFSDRFGVGITDLEDGTFELESSTGDTEIWDGWTNGTTIQIPDISNLSRTYACYAEEFQWDDDTWKFNHNSTCENEYFLDVDNTFAVFDYVFWHDYLSQYYHWSSNWEELDDGTINNYVANSYFTVDDSPFIGNMTDNAGMTQIVDIRLRDIQTEFDYDNHYAEDLHNKTQKAIGGMAAGSDVISYETHLMDLSQVNWVSLSGKGTLSDLASPPDISIDEDIEWRISLCEVYNYVFYLETSRDIFGFRWVAFDPDFVQEEDEEESLTAESREFSNWALDCENEFPFDFVWMSASYGGEFTPPGLEPINQDHQSTFYYNNNGIGITLLPNGTYQVDQIGWNGDFTASQYWTANSSMPAFEIPTLETFNLQLPCYYHQFGNSLGSFSPHHQSCNENVLIDLSNPAGMIDHYYDNSQTYWWPFSSWINHYLWSNGSAWNGDMLVENKISIISTNSSVQRNSDGQQDWSTYQTVLTIEELNVGSANLQYITNSHDGSIRYIQGIDTIGDLDQVPDITLPENYNWRITLCRLAASVGIYDAPFSIDAFRWVALPEPPVIEMIPGCTDHFANNFDVIANEDDGSCDYDLDDDGVLDTDEVAGCTDPTANNHRTTATEEDGSCDYDLDDDGVLDADEVAGCTDPTANNHHWWSPATDEDGSCDYDLDDDGVLDAFDLCPLADAGKVVDENGCSASQRDADGDGVSDESDQCSGTEYDEQADENGCGASQRDSDLDGYTDSEDQCPETPQDEEVDRDGCGPSQRDTDSDGLMDSEDPCPETFGSVGGCPAITVELELLNEMTAPGMASIAMTLTCESGCKTSINVDGKEYGRLAEGTHLLMVAVDDGQTVIVNGSFGTSFLIEELTITFSTSDEEVVLLDELEPNEEPAELAENTLSTFIVGNAQPITMLAFTSIMGAAFVQAESLRYPFSKRFWWGMAFMIGATRKDHRGEFQRGRIIGVLTTNQGIHLSALIRILGLGNHQAAHHLSVLEEQGKIWHHRVGREIRFFTSDVPKGMKTADLPNIDISINENSVPYRILVILYENQDARGYDFTQKELASTLNSSKQLVSYHVRILEERGFIERKRSGLGYRVAITIQGVRHILDDKHLEGSQIGIDQSILFDSIMNLNIEN